MEKVKLEKELKLQKAEKIMQVGGLVTSSEKFDKLINENKEVDLKNITKYQILFRKNVLCQKLLDKKLFRWVKQVTISTSHTLQKNLKIIIKKNYYFLRKANPLVQNV